MPLRRKVRDRMITIQNYPSVLRDATLKEAALSLKQSHCELDSGICTEAGPRTVLVLDESGELVGILDFRSFLEVLIPELAGGISAKLRALEVSVVFAEANVSNLDETHLNFITRVKKNAETKVEDIMLKVRGTIDADAGLMDALRMIYRNKITVLPVYEGGNLVGVVRDTDLFLAISDIFEGR
jgi:CBS domain-containing protein